MQLQDYITQIRVLVHDLSKNDWTDAELTTIVNAARTRVALDLHCVRTFAGGPSVFQGFGQTLFNLVANQEIYPIIGGIPGVTITNGGSGYVTPPSVTFSATGGVLATGTANLTGGVVTSVTMTNWGTGYTVPAGIAFGSGAATATPFVMNNVLDILAISFVWPGNTNRETMRWLPFTTFQAWCRAYTLQIGNPVAWTTHDGNNQIYIYPVPDQPYIIEIDFATLPTQTLVNFTDVDTNINPPYSDCVQYYGAYLARLKLQDFDKSDYFRKLYNTRTREVNATRIDRRIPNVYKSSARRMMRW